VIVKTGAGTLVLNLANTHSGGLRVEGGTVVIQNAAALNGGPLVINAGAKVMLDVGFTLVPLSSLTLDVAGLLDVGTGGITVASGGYTEADIRAALISGRNGGTWNGTAGIMFTAQSAGAAATAFSVGYAVDGNGVLTARHTADGDTQLDGKVDFDDILALFPNYGGTGSYVWSGGDITYDGKVDFDDILALFPNYGSDAVFGAGLLGQGGGSGSGNGGDGGEGGTSSPQSTGTGTGGGEQPVMGPEAQADQPTRAPTTLSRSTTVSGSGNDATSLAFAALASETQGTGTGDKKNSVFATL
jgi:fibronectin-binding autotransporter adhesin